MTPAHELLSFTRAPSLALEQVRDGFSHLPAFGAHLDAPMFEYSATLLSIVDGDTLKLEVDLGFHVRVRQVFRLARINCPELLSLEGMQARTFVAATLERATAMKVQTSRSEKYGRWLAEVYYQTKETGARWHNLNSLLLESKHARPYKH